MSYFNIRVYGLLINDQQAILVSDEQQYGRQFCKFPGGGLEFGEGTLDCLKREFREECDLDIEILDHFYTTDFYEKSSFNESQIVSIYYIVKPVSEFKVPISSIPFDFQGCIEAAQRFRWIPLNHLTEHDMAFKTDQTVVNLLIDFLK